MKNKMYQSSSSLSLRSMKVRLSKEQKVQLANSEDVYKIMQAVLLRQNRLHRQREHFWVMGLDLLNNVQYLELVAIGKLNTVNVDAIEVFSFASQKRCKKVIMIHNHPAGYSLKPSRADIEFTIRLSIGAGFLGMQVIDHLIINETDFITIGNFTDLKTLEKNIDKLKSSTKPFGKNKPSNNRLFDAVVAKMRKQQNGKPINYGRK